MDRQAIFTSKPGLKVIKIDKTISLGKDIEATVEAIVRDKAGNVTDYRRFKSKSFVANFIRLLWLKAAGWWTPNTLAIIDTGGVARNIYNYYAAGGQGYLRCNAVAGVVTYGVVVGTGAGAPTINDIQLGTLIAHGVGGGELQYSAVIFGAPVNDAATSQFTITRDFANGSGGAINVQECGLYVWVYDGATRYVMTIRDVTGGINVPNGQTLTLNYQINAAVPGFVRQFIQMLYVHHSFTDFTVKDISNADRLLDNTYIYHDLLMTSGPGNQDMMTRGSTPTSADASKMMLGNLVGIQIGSNAAAPTANDIAINTRIAHGVIGGQLLYGGSEIEDLTVAAPNALFLLRRYFTNKSGGDVNVREVGIYTPGFISESAGYQFLICRDTPALVTVANNELLRVQYTIQVTV